MKPSVRYSGVAFYSPMVGERAQIFIVDPHPVLGEIAAPKWVNTSKVVKVEENGDFETLNTLYKKV